MEAILFDLDNTLYSPEKDLFALIDVRINRYMHEVVGIAKDKVDALRRDYWARYGVTLQGLIRHFGVDPEDYLHYVHDVDVAERIAPDLLLRESLESLPMRRAVFTNGSAEHAGRVLAALGLDGLFDDVFDIRVASYIPKPRHEPYRAVVDRLGVAPSRCVMVEDSAANLETAKALGMRTVLVGPPDPASFIDACVGTAAEAAKSVSAWAASRKGKTTSCTP